MKREVVINIPMFIGIILLVIAMTALFVSGVNFTRELINRDNNNMDVGFGEMQNVFENRLQKNENTNFIQQNIEINVNIQSDNEQNAI